MCTGWDPPRPWTAPGLGVAKPFWLCPSFDSLGYNQRNGFEEAEKDHAELALPSEPSLALSMLRESHLAEASSYLVVAGQKWSLEDD